MLADPLTKEMEADKLIAFLETNVWDISQPIESVQKKRAKQVARRKAMATYERDDRGRVNYVLPNSDGPDIGIVTRRVTKDLATGHVIDDDHKVSSRDLKYLTREVPNGPRDARTVFYYPKSEEGATEVKGNFVDEANTAWVSKLSTSVTDTVPSSGNRFDSTVPEGEIMAAKRGIALIHADYSVESRV